MLAATTRVRGELPQWRNSTDVATIHTGLACGLRIASINKNDFNSFPRRKVTGNSLPPRCLIGRLWNPR